MNRKQQRREHIAPFILHSKRFEEKWLKEEVLSDGSIKFYFEGYASTTAKDGSGEIVNPKGIKLDRYLLNPIIKKGHKRGEENNIGMTESIQIKDDGMYIKAYAILTNDIEMHKSIIHWLRHGLIKGFSIWFGDVESHWDNEKEAIVIDSLELYEISLVDIPDNPLTISKAIEKYVKSLSPSSTKMFPKVWDMVSFKLIYCCEMYPEDPLLGKVIDVDTSGSTLQRWSVMNGSEENPIITVQIHEMVNGIETKTASFYIDEAERFAFMDAPETKQYATETQYKDAIDLIAAKTLEENEEGEGTDDTWDDKPLQGNVVVTDDTTPASDTIPADPTPVTNDTTPSDTDAWKDVVPSEGAEKALKEEQSKALTVKEFESYKKELNERQDLFEKEVARELIKIGNESSEIALTLRKTIDYLKTRVTNTPLAYAAEQKQGVGTLGKLIEANM